MEERLLRLELQHHPHLTVLRCSGRIVHGDGADTLLRAVKAQNDRHLQIDLAEVDTIDASGLGALAALEKWATEGRRTLQFINPSKRVLEAMETTRLSSVLQICSNSKGRETAA